MQSLTITATPETAEFISIISERISNLHEVDKTQIFACKPYAFGNKKLAENKTTDALALRKTEGDKWKKNFENVPEVKIRRSTGRPYVFILLGHDKKIIVVGRSTAHFDDKSENYGDLIKLYKVFSDTTSSILAKQVVNECNELNPQTKKVVNKLFDAMREKANHLVEEAVVIPINVSGTDQDAMAVTNRLERIIGNLVIFGDESGKITPAGFGARNATSHQK